MPPTLLLAVLLLVPSTLSTANKSPRHVASGSGLSFGGGSGASSFASSSAYSSSGAFPGPGVKGGCGGGCAPGGFASAGSKAGAGSFASGFGSGLGGGSSSSFVSSGGHGVFPGSDVAFWWAGADSPFKQAQEYYKKCALKGDCGNLPGPIPIPGFDASLTFPCGPVGCGKVDGNLPLGPIDISKNPFLNGEYKGIAISSCSGSACPGGKPQVTVTNCKGSECKTTKHEGEPLDLSGNPFLSGSFAGAGSFGSGSFVGGAGGSAFKSSHGAGSEIAHGKGKPGSFGASGVGVSGSFGHVAPTSQTGTTSGASSTSFTSTGFGATGFGGKPTCYPGKPGCGGQETKPGSYPSGSGKIPSGSHVAGEYQPGAGSYQPGKPGCSPGQPGCQTYPGESGKYPTGSGSYQPKPGCSPGQAGCQPGTTYPESGKYPTGSGSYQPGCAPGQAGCQPGTFPAGSASFPTGSGSYQPGKPSGSYPGGSGTFSSGSGSHQQGKPTCSPGQAGCDSSKYPSGTGSFPSAPGTYQPGKPSCSPGQPGCQTDSSKYPSGSGAFPTATGTYQPGKPSCTPGQPGCSDSGKYPSGSGAFPTGTGAYQPGKPSCSPGQPGCSDSGKYPSGSGTFPTGTGAYQPGKPSGTYPGESGTPSGSGAYKPSKPGTTYPTGSGSFTTGSGSYQPGKPSCTAGQPGCQSGSTYPGETGKYPTGSGTYQPGKPSCVPGQVGCPTSTYSESSFSFTSGGYQPGKPGCAPGQPGCKLEPNYPTGSGSYQPAKPSCSPGQPGCQPGSSYPTGSGSFPTGSGSYQPGKPSCTPGQPGCAYPGESGSFPSGASSYQPGKPGTSYPGPTGTAPSGTGYQPGQTCSPGQPGCEAGKPGKTCYPGQVGCDSSKTPSCFPGQPGCDTGKVAPQPIPTCYPGQPGCKSAEPPRQGIPSSYPGKTVPTCYPGQPGCAKSGSQAGPTIPTYTTGFGQSGFGSTGSGTTSYGSVFGQKATAGTPFGRPSGTGATAVEGTLTMKCSGAGYFCVEKYLCINGIISSQAPQVFQSKAEDQYCNVNTQICCRLSTLGRPDQQKPGGSQYFHSSSSSSSSASSASTSSNTFFTTSGIQASGPTAASHIASQYTPSKSSHPDSSGGLVHVPPKGGAPTGSGSVHILGEGQKPYSPGLVHIAPTSPGQSGIVHVLPTDQTFGSPTVEITSNGGKPSYVTPSSHETTFKDVKNELGFASTIQGPAYLPPDSSPTPNTYTPDLVPPKTPFIPNLPGSPSSPTPSILKPSTPKPVIYYPSSTTPRPGYLPPQQPDGSDITNEYLPPAGSSIVPTVTKRPQVPQIPDSNVININILKPPTDSPLKPDGAGFTETILRPPTPKPVTEYPFKGDLNTTPYPGCAAALKCVESQFCTAEGVISPTAVFLTKEQESNRVPLTECADPDTGAIGKCCRDPNYKDPWPASQLGLYNPNDGFDNGQYKESNTDGKYVRPSLGTKTPQPGVKGKPSRPYEPNQIGAPSNTPGVFVRPDQGYPLQVPNTPFDSRQVSNPLQVELKGPIEINYNGKQPYSPSKISSETCGVRRPGGYPKAIAPIDVDFAEIPWQAMILRDSNRSLLCGGAIIRRDAVLTAAHCVEGLHSDDVLVKGGEWKLGIDEEPKPFQIIKVAAIVRHPGYNPETKFNDIALLVLTEKFRLDKNVDTICLPGPDMDIQSSFQNTKCITTGWGKTILQLHVLNALLHSLDVGIIPPSQCQATLQQYHSQSVPYYNTNCICGATTQPNTDICDVDIGSALACDRGDGHYTLAGVYSWDTGCGTPSQLAGYTKVDTYWIESQLQRPINELKTEEDGFYQRLSHQHTGPDCHCQNGKK